MEKDTWEDDGRGGGGVELVLGGNFRDRSGNVWGETN